MNNSTTVVECTDGLDFETSNILDSVFMFLLFLALGAACEWEEIKSLRHGNPKSIAIIVLCQYGMMPLLAYLFGLAGDMLVEFKIAFVIALAAPGGALSNMICVIFQGDIPLSVGATGLSCLLGIALMPLNQYIYIVWGNMLPEGGVMCIRFWGIVWSAFVVVLGIACGILAKCYARQRLIHVIFIFGALGGIGIAALGIIANSKSTLPWWQLPSWYIPCVMAPAVIGPTVAWYTAWAAGVPGPSRLVVFLEVGIQNLPIAMASIGFVLPKQEAARAISLPVLYQITATVFLIAMSIVAWKCGYTNLPRDKSFLKAWRERRTTYTPQQETSIMEITTI